VGRQWEAQTWAGVFKHNTKTNKIERKNFQASSSALASSMDRAQLTAWIPRRSVKFDTDSQQSNAHTDVRKKLCRQTIGNQTAEETSTLKPLLPRHPLLCVFVTCCAWISANCILFSALLLALCCAQLSRNHPLRSCSSCQLSLLLHSPLFQHALLVKICPACQNVCAAPSH